MGQRFDAALEDYYRIPRARLAPFFAGPFSECILGRRDLKEAIQDHIVEWGWQSSVDELLAFWFQCEHMVCADALACVRALRRKGHVCALGTNQEKHRAAYMRREMRLAEEFDYVFVSCELGASKPDSAFFGRVEEQLRSPTSEIFLIDDAERNIAAAKTVGWRGIWYRGVSDLAAVEKEAN